MWVPHHHLALVDPASSGTVACLWCAQGQSSCTKVRTSRTSRVIPVVSSFQNHTLFRIQLMAALDFSLCKPHLGEADHEPTHKVVPPDCVLSSAHAHSRSIGPGACSS